MRYLALALVIVSTGCVPRASKTTTPTSNTTPEATIRATAYTIAHDWQTNEVGAKRDYLKQWVRIVGKVDNVKEGGHVTLEGDGYFHAVGCEFADKTGLGDLHQNEWVVVEGYGTGKGKFDKCRLIRAGFHTHDEAWAASK